LLSLALIPTCFSQHRSGAAAAKHGQEQGLEPSRAAEAALRAAGVLGMIRWMAKKTGWFSWKNGLPFGNLLDSDIENGP